MSAINTAQWRQFERRIPPAAHLAAQVYFELMLRLQVRVGLDSVMLLRESELKMSDIGEK